jgi:hypothetical protein
MMTLNDLLELSKEDGRICPQPLKWKKFYELLPGKKQQSHGGWEPSLPLILAAWYEAAPALKAQRFESHIKWAAEHGALEKAFAFLASLNPEDWYFGD